MLFLTHCSYSFVCTTGLSEPRKESLTTTEAVYRRVTDKLQTSHRRIKDHHRPVHIRVTGGHSRVTDELFQKAFFQYIYKILFSETIWFPNVPMKRWILLKKGKSKIWCLLKWWKLSDTRNQTILRFYGPFCNQKRRQIFFFFYAMVY